MHVGNRIILYCLLCDISAYLKLDDDFGTIYQELWDVRSKWRYLGLALGLKPATLDAIETDHRYTDKCLYNVLLMWLKASPWRSWEDLFEALSVKTVGCQELAKQLRDKYCSVHSNN